MFYVVHIMLTRTQHTPRILCAARRAHYVILMESGEKRASHTRMRVRVPRPIYPEFVSVIEASRSVLFVRYRGRESNCGVHLCD